MTGASDPATVAAGLTEAQRRAVLRSKTWSGDISISPLLLSLNGIELLHLDVVKSGEGRIAHWGAHLTPLGLAVRRHLQEPSNAPR